MRELQIAFITNPMIRRWMRILTIVEREETFTAISLAQRLTISQRTIVKDIHLINEHFGESIAVYSNNSGFHFEERDRLMYQEKKEELLEQDVLFEIMEKLYYGETTDLEELAHQYSYAESTLRRFLIKTQPILKDYGLTLSFKPVKLLGEEANIRKFFFDFYNGGEQTPQTVRPPEGLHPLLLQGLSEELSTQEVGTGLSIGAFYSLLYLTMVRVQQKQFIMIPQWAQDLVYKERDFRLLELLVPLIEKEYGITLPKEELAWLHLMIISKRTIHRLDQEVLFLNRFDQWPELKNVSVSYFSLATFDQWSRDRLETFMQAFLASRKLSELLWPIWNKPQAEAIQLAKQYDSYEKNALFLKKKRKELNFSAAGFEDLTVSFALFSELLLHAHQPQKNVLFLLEGDSMVVQTIRIQAERLFGEKYQLRFLSLHELTEERLKSRKTDLIVTNYRPYIFEYELTEDYLLLNPIPNEKDWERVKKKLHFFSKTDLSKEGFE